MTDKPIALDFATKLSDSLRSVRARYDQLERGKTAAIRRCRTADELVLEGIFWHVGGKLAQEQKHLAHVVLHFPLAPHRGAARFSFGRYLARKLGDSPGAALRFRRLLDCRDRDELDHRLRAVLRLAAQDRSPIDWGSLGTDVLWFFAESDGVRRRWAQDFYAPLQRDSAEMAANPANAAPTETRTV